MPFTQQIVYERGLLDGDEKRERETDRQTDTVGRVGHPDRESKSRGKKKSKRVREIRGRGPFIAPVRLNRDCQVHQPHLVADI